MNYPDNVYHGTTPPWLLGEEEPLQRCAVCGEPIFEGDRAYLGYDMDALSEQWFCSEECVLFYEWEEEEKPVMVEA